MNSVNFQTKNAESVNGIHLLLRARGEISFGTIRMDRNDWEWIAMDENT